MKNKPEKTGEKHYEQCTCHFHKPPGKEQFGSAHRETDRRREMLMYGKEASNRKQEIDRQHYTIPNQRPKDKHCGKI